MGIQRTAKTGSTTTARKSTTTRSTAKAASTKAATATPERKVATRRTTKVAAKRAVKTPRPTLASVSAQLEALTLLVSTLTEMLRDRFGTGQPVVPPAIARPNGSPETADFDGELLAVLGDLDRRARHSGLVPIPAVRRVFAERGWTRNAFDERLLQAERDFIVDLKAANDPGRLAEPALAIQQPGRGHLQFVVAR